MAKDEEEPFRDAAAAAAAGWSSKAILVVMRSCVASAPTKTRETGTMAACAIS